MAVCFVKEQDSVIQGSERTPSAIWFLAIWQACAGVDESTCVCFWVIFHTLRRQASKGTPGLWWDSSHHKNLSNAPRFLVAALPLVTIQFIKYISRKHTSSYRDKHSLNFFNFFLSPNLPPSFPLPSSVATCTHPKIYRVSQIHMFFLNPNWGSYYLGNPKYNQRESKKLRNWYLCIHPSIHILIFKKKMKSTIEWHRRHWRNLVSND